MLEVFINQRDNHWKNKTGHVCDKGYFKDQGFGKEDAKDEKSVLFLNHSWAQNTFSFSHSYSWKSQKFHKGRERKVLFKNH